MSRIDPKRFARDEHGAVAIIVALMLVMVMGFVALGVDVGALYRERAQLQAAADLAAVSAAAQTEAATVRAETALVRNAYEPNSLTNLQTGRYVRNPELAPSARFTALSQGTPGINAVRVTVADTAPLHFATLFAGQKSVDLQRTAMATRTGAIRFSLDSHILRLGATAISDLLSDALSAEINLNDGEIATLDAASINVASLLDALGTQIGLSPRNPADLLYQTVQARDLLAAISTLLPSSAQILTTAIATASGDLDVPVSALVTGLDADLGLTATGFLDDSTLTALDTLLAIAQSTSTSNTQSMQTALSVSGVTSASATLTSGTPPAQSGWAALGEEGVTLHRAALRAQIELGLDPTLLGGLVSGVVATSLDLPILLEVAGATATLDTLDCRAEHGADTVATFITGHNELHPLNGTSLAALYLGSFAAMPSVDAPIDPSALDYADILDLTLTIPVPLLPDIEIEGLTLQAKSATTVGASGEASLSFSKSDVASAPVTKHFGSEEMLTNAVGSLLSPAKTSIRVKPSDAGMVSSLAAPLVNAVLAALPEALATQLTAPVDAVLDTLLADLGISLGEGALTLEGQHCEAIRLAQ